MYRIILKPRARKQYGRLHEKDRRRVLAALQGLREDPQQGKKLEGKLAGIWSVRVWPYRILYSIDQNTIIVTVVAIGQRKDVYRKLRR